MALIIQIALGILLGFLLIEYREQLGRWALLGVKVLFGAIIFGAVITTISYLPEAVGVTAAKLPDRLARIGEGLALLPGVLLLFVVVGTGTYGFILIVRKALRGRWNLGAEPASFILLGFVNVLLIWPVDLYLQWQTPYGEFYRSVDRWSRDSGLADAGASLLSFSLTLWPWLIILAGRRFGIEFSPKDVPKAPETAGHEEAD
jgi:hypothetical protein